MARAIDGAGHRGGAGRGAFATGPEEPREAGRPDEHRQAHALAEELDRKIALAGPCARGAAEAEVGECRFVTAKRALILGAAVGEIEDRPRQDASRLRAQSRDVVGAPPPSLKRLGHGAVVIRARKSSRRRMVSPQANELTRTRTILPDPRLAKSLCLRQVRFHVSWRKGRQILDAESKCFAS